MKLINCAICGTSFKSRAVNAKYCSDPCRDKAKMLNREEWNRRNPNYDKEYSKAYRENKRKIKLQRQEEHRQQVRKIIEDRTGGLFER